MVPIRETSRPNKPCILLVAVLMVAPAGLTTIGLTSISAANAASNETANRTNANQLNANQSVALTRPSIQLLNMGLRFTAPKGWTAEDYPQLNGVLLLSPAANDTPKTSWRTRILIEVAKPQATKDLAALAATNTVSILGPGTEWREVARKIKRHAQGFDYGWAESTQRRDPHALRDWRIVIKPKSGDELIVITMSTARALWDIERAGIETFIDQLKLL